MNLGLLICDHARKELKHPDGSYPEMFRRLLPDFDLTDYYVCDGIFPGSPDACEANLLMMCQDQVVELPPDTTLLARSPLCPNAMIRVGKNMLGIQGHPEFSVDFEHKLILANARYLEPDQVAVGIKSLEQPVHSLEVGGWMKGFLSST